jgi:non-canonical purine NTP pyrophosphatase (RdgB/HAM1 family)
MKCVVFTNNQGKLKELRDLLSSLNMDVVGYKDVIHKTIDVVEDGTTFHDNALKKVQALANFSDDIYVADDSGLEIDVLNNEPGVYSARYGGGCLTDHERCEYVLEKLHGRSNRRARFKCVLAVIMPDKSQLFFEGKVEGVIAEKIIGTQGFGYDPIFIPEGYSQTFGALGVELKYKISHRARAMVKLKDCLLSRV